MENEYELLKKKRNELKTECEQLLEKLDVLWEGLGCPNYFREKYSNIAKQFTQSAVDLLTEEFKRCKAVRQQKMKEYVEKIRVQIVNMWDKCYKSQQERDQFRMMNSDAYNDDLLTLHEIELEECKRFFNENK